MASTIRCGNSNCKSGPNTPLMACSSCKQVYYCGVVCQRFNWPTHKVPCNETKKQTQRFLRKINELRSAGRFRNLDEVEKDKIRKKAFYEEGFNVSILTEMQF